MFVLDTNILSALMTPEPVPEVAAWVASQPARLLFTASICQTEILSGIAIMPALIWLVALTGTKANIFGFSWLCEVWDVMV